MRPEFIPCPHDDEKVAEYRNALMKVGVGIVTTAEALDDACRHVTDKHACITSDVVAAYPHVVNMIAHGGFEDSSGRVMLVLPPDRESFKIVRDAIADSHTSITGLASEYIGLDLVRAIEKTADRLGFSLGARSTLTLPRWYTIFPSSGLHEVGHKVDRKIFDRRGNVVGVISGKGGHFSHEAARRKFKHAVIDIRDPESIGLPGPCYLDVYASSNASVAEIKPGFARVSADRCWMDPKPHEHAWKSFWAFVPDYSEKGYCALLEGERCTREVLYKPLGKRSADGVPKATCSATRKVRVLKKSKAILEPQPPREWRLYAGLEVKRDHVHLWSYERVRWKGASVFDIRYYSCTLCDAEVWPKEVEASTLVYRCSYGPAVDRIAKSMRFPKEIRTAFVRKFGSYVGDQKVVDQYQALLAKVERELSDEIRAFNEAAVKVKGRWSAKTPLSVFLDLSEQIAKEHGRRWKAPSWLRAAEQDPGEGGVDDEDGEAGDEDV